MWSQVNIFPTFAQFLTINNQPPLKPRNLGQSNAFENQLGSYKCQQTRVTRSISFRAFMSGPAGLLQGLGKATKRGIRKCPQCGTLNGTRGLSCKNRTCDWVFQHPAAASALEVTAPARAPGGRSSTSQRPGRPLSGHPHDPCLLVTDASPLQRLFSLRLTLANSSSSSGCDGLEQRAFVLLHTPAVSAHPNHPEEAPASDPYSLVWPNQNACYAPDCAEPQVGLVKWSVLGLVQVYCEKC